MYYSMKNLFIFVYLIVLTNCTNTNNDHPCPFTTKFGAGHMLKVPISVFPQRLTYKVGDTIALTANFTNMIEDINYERTFEIDNALFRPVITLLRFENGDYKGKISGPNNFIVDTLNLLGFGNSVHTYVRYDNGAYKWNTKIILQKKGSYVMTIEDISNSSEEELIKTRHLFSKTNALMALKFVI
jgi:hypothetical protein